MEHTRYLGNWIDKQVDKHDESILAEWLEEQLNDYDEDIKKSKGLLKVQQIHQQFTDFLNDPRFNKYVFKKLRNGYKMK
tara:strand:+ start:489 stop:725 length:237 start_codon:yes stop_codon:yes gene_type:complete